MAKFEEYRQPWETGPHWELKREFMEKYQNDYPLDRLLCLAQAYSNIELLHCSYPEPVMREVYQLSCQLQGCKRFREAEAELERRKKEEKEMQPRKAGKRRLSSGASSKSFKFIKFCSSQEASIESKTSNEFDKYSKDFIQCDTRASTNDSKTSDDSGDVNKNSISANTDSNGSALSSNNSNVIFSLSNSPDFSMIQKFAAAIPKKSTNSLESIERAIEISGLENAVKYIFLLVNKSWICCQFYVGSALISTGRDTIEKTAKERAVQYGVEVLTNLSNLPHKTLEDVKKDLQNWKKSTHSELLWSEMLSSDFESKSKMLKSQLSEMEKNPSYADLHLILSIIEKLFDKNIRNKNIAVSQKIMEAASKLKCGSQVYFLHVSEDPDTPLHIRAFHCDLIIKNMFICQSKASSKRKAKADAAEHGFELLTNFIENCEIRKQEIVQDQEQSLETKFECSKHFATDRFTNESPVADNLPQTHIKTSVPNSECDTQNCRDSKSKPKLFRINHKLLTNSKNRQLIVIDSSNTNGLNGPIAILNYTASKCKKDLQFIAEEISVDESKDFSKLFRCTVTLDGEEIGKSQAYSGKEAKSKAAENALNFLQKCVYTIKVKDEIEDSFVITRSHVLSAENPSSVLSESNVGCKMLKMMGWTGGGIGKTSGITEPIVAEDHRFGQGLGFSNNKAQEKSFRHRIEALLKDYSQTDTTSDLIFSTEFSKEERKQIHNIAQKFNLQSNSKGKGNKRRLFIGRKFEPMDLLERLVEAGGSTPKYELEDRSAALHKVGKWPTMPSKSSLLFR